MWRIHGHVVFDKHIKSHLPDLGRLFCPQRIHELLFKESERENSHDAARDH